MKCLIAKEMFDFECYILCTNNCCGAFLIALDNIAHLLGHFSPPFEDEKNVFPFEERK